MVSTAIATEMTSVIRDFGTGVETQGRALRSSVRHLVLAAGATESRIARDIHVPATQVLALLAGALRGSASLLETEPDPVSETSDVTIVDRDLTRC